MKKILLTFMFLPILILAEAQLSLRPKEGFGNWSEWGTITYDADTKNPETKLEYRIMLDSRSGLACNYQIEIKNISEIKMSGNLKVAYHDYLVNAAVGPDIQKYSLKPGQSKVFKVKVQGCTKQGDKNLEDKFKICTNCIMSYEITRFYK